MRDPSNASVSCGDGRDINERRWRQESFARIHQTHLQYIGKAGSLAPSVHNLHQFHLELRDVLVRHKREFALGGNLSDAAGCLLENSKRCSEIRLDFDFAFGLGLKAVVSAR
jgi:GTP1/Obg family GTP-binding protein